ncbi:hypothetical protein EIN_282740 [Entamoeba invadens IP1]|uniref:Leucine rich repeat containing protein BspA family protein n=1 Tax=Entamoeba invadens IP1 TaxID=370355 RepID=A0A0A1TX80_ENTIV|nr:hypothetical protein EIN_282740 [Entamoeba invadens IP1]ELP85873.1 hypothetical protein EIN_282740 [Entamoeba invadens IP1]|eukprot:XP_004185219.1 hypothetical protein EIN_282740 [Entamoeba invadens IP1]
MLIVSQCGLPQSTHLFRVIMFLCVLFSHLGEVPETFKTFYQKLIGAFQDCQNLSCIKLPSRLSEISYIAFSGCQELLDLNIPKSVESLKMLEYGLKSIGEICFDGCISLNTIEIPDSVTEIGWHAFAECTQLQKTNFQNYFSMTEFEFLYKTKSIKSIQSSCFIDCKSLKCIYIPEGVFYISDDSFLRCTSLSKITFPYTVESYGVQSFIGLGVISPPYFFTLYFFTPTFHFYFNKQLKFCNFN